jgi:hypothetical protein
MDLDPDAAQMVPSVGGATTTGNGKPNKRPRLDSDDGSNASTSSLSTKQNPTVGSVGTAHDTHPTNIPTILTQMRASQLAPRASPQATNPPPPLTPQAPSQATSAIQLILPPIPFQPTVPQPLNIPVAPIQPVTPRPALNQAGLLHQLNFTVNNNAILIAPFTLGPVLSSPPGGFLCVYGYNSKNLHENQSAAH